jgi:RNA polymerase sigma-70 factor, ECF subfamily
MGTMTTERWRVSCIADLRPVYESVFDDTYRYAARLAGPDRQHAEDLVQDAFVDAARRIRAGETMELSIGWFITAIRHRFIDQVRRAAVRERTVTQLAQNVAVDAGATDDGNRVLAGLTDVERLALVLHHVEGRSVREVARTIGRSRRATESLLARARARARRTIEEERS